MKRSHRKNGDFKQTFGIELEELDNHNFVDLVVRPFCMQILSEQTLQEWETGRAPQNHRRRVEYKLTRDFKATLPAAHNIVLPANIINPFANHPAQGPQQFGATRGVAASTDVSKSTPDTTTSAVASLHAINADKYTYTPGTQSSHVSLGNHSAKPFLGAAPDSEQPQLRLSRNTRGEQGVVAGKRHIGHGPHHNLALQQGDMSSSGQAVLSAHQLNYAGGPAAGEVSLSSLGVALPNNSSQSLQGFASGHATSNTRPVVDSDSTSDSDEEVAGAVNMIAAAAAEIESAQPSQARPTEQEVFQRQSARSVNFGEVPGPESFSYYEGTPAFTPLASQSIVSSTHEAEWALMESKIGARLYYAYHLEACTVVGRWLFGNSFLIACPHCGQNADENLTLWENIATVLQHIRVVHPYEWQYWKHNIHQCVKRCTSTGLSFEDVYAIESGLNSVRARGPVITRIGQTESVDVQEYVSPESVFTPQIPERETAPEGPVAKSRALKADSSSDDEPLIKRMRKG